METFANKQDPNIKQCATVSNNTSFHIESQQNIVECIFYQVSNNLQSATWLVVPCTERYSRRKIRYNLFCIYSAVAHQLLSARE